MSPFAKTSFDDLEESLGSGSPGLQHDREDSKQDDLDGGATGVPVRSRDSILEIKREQVSKQQCKSRMRLIARVKKIITQSLSALSRLLDQPQPHSRQAKPLVGATKSLQRRSPSPRDAKRNTVKL